MSVTVTLDHQNGSKCYPALKYCERYLLNERNWQFLDNMHKCRAYFNPCEFLNYVYLCGSGSSAIEAFSPRSSTFHLLKAKLPEKTSCLLICGNMELVVISKNCTSVFHPGKGWELNRKSIRAHPEYEVVCEMPPIANAEKGVAYYTTRGVCYRVSIDGQLHEYLGRENN